MAQRKFLERVAGHGVVAMALVTAFAVLSACSSDDKRPLVLLNVTLGTYAVAPETVTIVVTAGPNEIARMNVSATENPDGKLGIWLPDGTSGNITIHASVLGSGGCVLASGSTAGVATAGETTGPFLVPLAATGDLCAGDAAIADTALPPEEVGAPLDTAPTGADSATSDAAIPVEGRPDGGPDTRVPDASSDQIMVIDAGLDSSGDVPIGSDAADAPAPLDAQPESAEAGVTIMNVFDRCTAYDHSDSWSADCGVRQIVYSPDGKYLVSVGDDSRVKVWRVTPTGIAPIESKLVFPGGNQRTVVAFSPDGQYLAVGHGYDVAVTVYDFAASVVGTTGAVSKWTIPKSLSPDSANSVERLRFTSDGKHLVAFYQGHSLLATKQNDLVVWELATTPTNMKHVIYALAEIVYAVVPGPGDFGTSLTVASAAVATADAGYQSTISVSDIMAVPPSRLQGSLPGEVDQMAFAPDGSVIVGVSDSGEISRWTSGATSLVRQPLLLVPESAAGAAANLDFAFTSDGRYLAAATYDWTSSSVKLVPLALDQSLRTKNTDHDPWSVAFAPSGIALAIGESMDATLLYCTP